MHNSITAIGLAGLAAFIFGSVYYMSLGRAYQTALGNNLDDCKGKKPPIGPLAICLVAEWIMASMIVTIFAGANIHNAQAGVISGAMLGAGFMATSTIVNNAFPGRKPMLSLIDSIHWIVVAAIEGAVIGALL